MKTSFARDKWNKDDFIQAYTFRFAETPDFSQKDDCIENAVNPSHKEGFDNISLLTKETYSIGSSCTIHCSFEGWGCPEIILVESPEKCDDGAVRYGACFETVLYKNGFNVWRHFRENGTCTWHQRLGVGFSVSENAIHEMKVTVRENYLDIEVDGKKNILRTEDLPSRFHFGITVCEGIARVYDMEVNA